MANQEHFDILKRGVEEWNRWRNSHREIQPDLSGADLNFADLCDAHLSRADLHCTHLHGTQLRRANLNYAKLSEVDLSEADLCYANVGIANLRRANLIRANLSYTNLSYTDLSHTDLREANLHKANLSGANMCDVNLNYANLRHASVGETIFACVDLCTAKGLAEVDHHRSSHITLHTIQLPQNGSALHFLRGVGLPDEWIDDYRARMMYPIQYHSCFISYSSKDETLARRLHADLQDRGVRCWFAPHDMKIGDKIRSRIDEAIHVHEKLLLLLSEHAIESSWVEDEVETALEKEKRQMREVLFPVRLDESVIHTSQAWAAKLRRTRHIGDFTHWTDPQIYQQAFDRLLRDLKAAKQRRSRN